MYFQWFLNGAETRERELVGVYSFMNYLKVLLHTYNFYYNSNYSGIITDYKCVLSNYDSLLFSIIFGLHLSIILLQLRSGTTSGKTSDKEWQRMVMSDSKWEQWYSKWKQHSTLQRMDDCHHFNDEKRYSTTSRDGWLQLEWLNK